METNEYTPKSIDSVRDEVLFRGADRFVEVCRQSGAEIGREQVSYFTPREISVNKSFGIGFYGRTNHGYRYQVQKWEVSIIDETYVATCIEEGTLNK